MTLLCDCGFPYEGPHPASDHAPEQTIEVTAERHGWMDAEGEWHDGNPRETGNITVDTAAVFIQERWVGKRRGRRR